MMTLKFDAVSLKFRDIKPYQNSSEVKSKVSSTLPLETLTMECFYSLKKKNATPFPHGHVHDAHPRQDDPQRHLRLGGLHAPIRPHAPRVANK